MRPAGPSRGVLDPATYHTSKSIANAMRGGGAGSGPSIPATLLVLIALAVALPALSFFAMHARVLDHQQTLTENYAVRHEATTIRSARASTASCDDALFGRTTHCAALLTNALPRFLPTPLLSLLSLRRRWQN